MHACRLTGCGRTSRDTGWHGAICFIFKGAAQLGGLYAAAAAAAAHRSFPPLHVRWSAALAATDMDVQEHKSSNMSFLVVGAPQRNDGIRNWMREHNISSVTALEQLYIRRLLRLATDASERFLSFFLLSIPLFLSFFGRIQRHQDSETTTGWIRVSPVRSFGASHRPPLAANHETLRACRPR